MQKQLIFIVLFAACISLNSCSNAGKISQDKNVSERSGEVTVYVTSSDRKFDLEKTSVSFSKRAEPSATVISLNPDNKYQAMEGFGAAITGSTCYNLMQMAPADRKEFLDETFS